MREILFRGKRVDNGQWVEGDLSHTNSGEPVIQYWVKSDRYKEGALIYFLVTPETVGQYTGLNDRNGNKIWEGDALRPDAMYSYRFYDLGQVMFEPDYGSFIVKGKYSRIQHHEILDCDIASTCEIVGNIHDNPELIAQ